MKSSSTRAKIAVIGAGWWAAENHIPLLRNHPGVELVGICGIKERELKRVQDAFEISFATTEFDKLLALSPLDGVVISSPHVCHFEHASAAIKRGYHVLVEKPFTTDASQARELVRLGSVENVEIVVAFGWNFGEVAAAARQYIAEGRLGKVEHIVLHMASPTKDLFLAKPLEATKSHLLQPDPSTWTDVRRAGGFGWGQLSHALGLVFYLIEDSPQTAYAECTRSEGGIDLHDAAIVRLAGGAKVVISGSSGLPQGNKQELDVRLYGSRGSLAVDFDRERVTMRPVEGKAVSAVVTPGSGKYSCVRPVEYFVDVCLGRASINPATGVVGCRATEVLDALYRSARSGSRELI